MDKQFLKFLDSQYAKSIIKSYGLADGGFLSDNYIVGDDNHKYFLKQYRPQYTEKEIINMHKVKNYFSENGVPVILPILTSEDNSYVEFNNRFYALFPYVCAKTIKPEKASKAAVISMAETQARMQLLSRRGLPKIHDKSIRLWERDKVLQKGDLIMSILNDIEEPDSFDRLALKYVGLKMRLIRANKITPESLGLECDHLIHGDFHGLNVFFGDEDCVKYVFDFEKTVNAPRAYELSKAIDYICLNDNNLTKAGVYLSAYRRVYPILDAEFRKGFYFHYFKSLHTFWIEENHYLMNNKRTDVFYEIEYKKTQLFSKDLDGLISKITNLSKKDV